MYSEIYLKAVYARRESILIETLSSYPKDLIEYLKDLPDDNMYLLRMKGITFGRTTNQLSEVGQQIIMPMRRLPLTTGLLFHQKDCERIQNIQTKTENRTNLLTQSAES